MMLVQHGKSRRKLSLKNYNTALVQLPLVRETVGERVRIPEDVYHACRDIALLAQEAFHVISLRILIGSATDSGIISAG